MLNLKRAIIDILILGGMLWVPWIVLAAALLVLGWYYRYYEMIFIGFLFDIFYNSPLYAHIGRHFFNYPFTIAGFSIFVILHVIKGQTRFRS